MQVLVFAVGSVLSVYCVRPFALRYLHPNKADRPSNADALLGREGVVIEAIRPDRDGYVKVDGDEWRAVAKDGGSIAKGERVRIVGRESIIVTVEQI